MLAIEIVQTRWDNPEKFGTGQASPAFGPEPGSTLRRGFCIGRINAFLMLTAVTK
jgi:hypothetical protein